MAGHPTLLDSYGEERRPIAALTVEQAYRRHFERVDPSLPSIDLALNIADTAIELGAVYRSCAVVSQGEDRELVEARERPSGSAGTRLAHVWIEHRGERVSTLDLAGKRLVLLAGPGGAGWVEAACGIGRLECVQLADGAVASSVGLAADGALLLRPDGVIAWRCNREVANPLLALTKAIRRVFG